MRRSPEPDRTPDSRARRTAAEPREVLRSDLALALAPGTKLSGAASIVVLGGETISGRDTYIVSADHFPAVGDVTSPRGVTTPCQDPAQP